VEVAALLLGALIAGGIIVALLLLGLVITAIRYIVAPPPPPPPGPCAHCAMLQSFWDSMSWLEKGACALSYAGASLVCLATGCNGLDLRF
jgi:hypothetical protein